MEAKLRGLDRYEVEAIQYDGTNSDEICQFILEHEPDTQIEGAFLNKGTDKKMMAVIVIPSGEVRYNAQFKQETLQWTKPTKPEKS
jgi:hypothetical protein